MIPNRVEENNPLDILAEIIEPAASDVAFLLPGEIMVSPSKETKPFFGNELLTKLIYSAL
mgnify:CR=1 FL=1